MWLEIYLRLFTRKLLFSRIAPLMIDWAGVTLIYLANRALPTNNSLISVVRKKCSFDLFVLQYLLIWKWKKKRINRIYLSNSEDLPSIICNVGITNLKSLSQKKMFDFLSFFLIIISEMKRCHLNSEFFLTPSNEANLFFYLLLVECSMHAVNTYGSHMIGAQIFSF